ncbi:MAG: SGNH/GDSL hydrolase family protein [Gammaproteobacteria bacterium]
MPINHLVKFVFLLVLIFSSWAQAAPSFNQIYVFGDSLSDTGNLASIVGDLPAPYYMNRISNGPIAVETLAAKLGLSAEASLHLVGPEMGSNYAVARANAYGNDIFDLNTQLISFQTNHGFMAPADALYVMFIGGNDVRDALYVADFTVAKLQVKAAAAEVQHAIESLAQAGAQSFLLVNSPNIAVIPETRLMASYTDDPRLTHRAHKLSKLYRTLIHEITRKLDHDNNINISEFDLFKFFNKLVKKADRYGFSNSTDACFSPSAYPETLFHPDCNYGMSFDQFIFFDEIHPTARVHELVGEALYKTLKKHEYDDCDCVRVRI